MVPLLMMDWRVCIFTLKHHLKLLPASVAVVIFLGIDVEAFQVNYSPGIEYFLVPQLAGELK